MDERAPTTDELVGFLLRDLAVRGLGTVLGDEDRRGRGGVRRVSRTGTDATGLEALFREQRTSMLAYARRHADPDAAEDAVQRAFEKVWKRRPVLDDLDNPMAYLVTAVRNEVHRTLRRTITDRERTVSADDDVEWADHRVAVDVSTLVSARMTLREELARLSGREREAVVLRVQWQLSVAEAADVMGVSTGAVKGYTHHGLRKLKAALATR